MDDVKEKGNYPMGNAMTFPLELAQIRKEDLVRENKYLYPVEVLEIQNIIEDACDRLEYDGSFMYDEYPDKIRMEKMVKNICRKCKCPHMEEISNRWMNALVQMMLCNEMEYRRNRREFHKRNMRKKAN